MTETESDLDSHEDLQQRPVDHEHRGSDFQLHCDLVSVQASRIELFGTDHHPVKLCSRLCKLDNINRFGSKFLSHDLLFPEFEARHSLGFAGPERTQRDEPERDEQLLLGLGRADRLLDDAKRVLAGRWDRVVHVRDADRHDRRRHDVHPPVAAQPTIPGSSEFVTTSQRTGLSQICLENDHIRTSFFG